MNKIASILLAGLLAIIMLGGFIALVGGSIVGALVFVIGIPVAFPMSTSVVVLFFTVIIIRTVIEKRRQKREMRKYLDRADD
jgi:membrane protein implicated in regulation of membrane protease activity